MSALILAESPEACLALRASRLERVRALVAEKLGDPVDLLERNIDAMLEDLVERDSDGNPIEDLAVTVDPFFPEDDAGHGDEFRWERLFLIARRRWYEAFVEVHQKKLFPLPPRQPRAPEAGLYELRVLRGANERYLEACERSRAEIEALQTERSRVAREREREDPSRLDVHAPRP